MIATTVNDDSLKRCLVASAGIHIFFLLFLYFGLPVFYTLPPEHHAPVPFEIVTVADITNTRIKDQEPKPEPKPEPPPPKPEPPKQQEPPPQVQALPKPPEPVAEALKPAIKPKPPEPAKPKTDEFAKLLKNLETKKPEPPKTETKADSKAPPAQEANSAAPALSDRLTISEEDLLRRQMAQCWNIPIGARDAQTLVVEVIIDVNPDRTVQHAEVVDKARMATDSFYRAAAEAALRALYNPKCTPLELPADKYEQWKRIDFTFDPRDQL